MDQRRHDALEEALERLLASRCLPARGGQPSVIQLHMDLHQLLGLDGAGPAVADWAGYGATAPPGADCDATIVPVVTGHVDPGLLDQLAATLLRPGAPGTGTGGAGVAGPCGSGPAWEPALPSGRLSTPAQAGRMSYTPAPEPGTAARELILTRATRLLAGPHGLASWLRQSLTSGPAGVVSLPLDIGIPTEIIPPHLRRGRGAAGQALRVPRLPPAPRRLSLRLGPSQSHSPAADCVGSVFAPICPPEPSGSG